MTEYGMNVNSSNVKNTLLVCFYAKLKQGQINQSQTPSDHQNNFSWWLEIVVSEISVTKKLKEDIIGRFENTSLFTGFVKWAVLI